MQTLILLAALIFGQWSSLSATNWDALIEHRCPREVLCKTHHEGKNYWIKRPDPKKFTLVSIYWRKLLGLVIPLKILKPHVIISPTKLVELELERNTEFKKKGIPVPTFVHRMKNTLVFTDEGLDMEVLIRMEQDLNLRATLLKQAVEALSQLHKKELYHGRPLLKDMLYRDGTVYFIDLAEAFCPRLTIAQAQARDVIMFVYAALPYIGNNSKQMLELLEGYDSPHKDKILKHIRKTMKWLTPVTTVVKPIAKWLGNDTMRAIAAHKTLSQLSQ